ncbi:MFS transporter [Lysinibacillus fusiformis]|uniref:MFS transporter n=1 Tax=Lysinibacillus sp. PWR01 TaxID=3342384 RepID=UPI00372D5EF6
MKRWDQLLFLVIAFIFWFAHFLYIPMLSPYIEHLGGTFTFTGIVLASYGLMQFLFRVPTGISSDLLNNRKLFVVLGMAISTASCLAFALTESLEWVLISRALAGIAAATWVAFTILFSNYAADDKLHSAMGNLSFALVFAQLLGMALSAWLVEELGWDAPYWIGTILGGIGLLLSFFISEENKRPVNKPIKLRELGTVVREPMLLKVSLLSIFAHSIIFTTMFGFTTAYALSKGLRPAEISLVVFAFMIPHAIATLMSGKPFILKIGKWRILQLAFLTTAIFTMLMALIETKILFLFLQMMNGFALGLLFPLFLGMAVEKIPHDKRATAMGAYQAIYAIGMFVGPFVAGLLNTSFGLEASFYFSGCISILGFICSLIWSREIKPITME